MELTAEVQEHNQFIYAVAAESLFNELTNSGLDIDEAVDAIACWLSHAAVHAQDVKAYWKAQIRLGMWVFPSEQYH